MFTESGREDAKRLVPGQRFWRIKLSGTELSRPGSSSYFNDMSVFQKSFTDSGTAAEEVWCSRHHEYDARTVSPCAYLRISTSVGFNATWLSAAMREHSSRQGQTRSPWRSLRRVPTASGLMKHRAPRTLRDCVRRISREQRRAVKIPERGSASSARCRMHGLSSIDPARGHVSESQVKVRKIRPYLVNLTHQLTQPLQQ